MFYQLVTIFLSVLSIHITRHNCFAVILLAVVRAFWHNRTLFFIYDIIDTLHIYRDKDYLDEILFVSGNWLIDNDKFSQSSKVLSVTQQNVIYSYNKVIINGLGTHKAKAMLLYRML